MTYLSLNTSPVLFVDKTEEKYVGRVIDESRNVGDNRHRLQVFCPFIGQSADACVLPDANVNHPTSNEHAMTSHHWLSLCCCRVKTQWDYVKRELLNDESWVTTRGKEVRLTDYV